MLRLTQLQTVLRQIAGLMGTRWEDLTAEEAIEWVDLFNFRLRTAWEALQWPQLRQTEQRYFQDGEWTVGTNTAAGQTMFDPTSKKYWTANVATTQPIGGSDWTQQTEPLYRLIPWDQNGQSSLGDIYAITRHDPRTHRDPKPLDFDINGDGLVVHDHRLNSAYIQFRSPVPMFTGERWVSGQDYSAGDLVYDPDAGDTFVALLDNNEAPTNTDVLGVPGSLILVTETGAPLAVNAPQWQLVGLPEFLAATAARGLYADVLRGDGQSDKAALEEQVAQNLLLAEMKKVVHQMGQLPRVRVIGARTMPRYRTHHHHYAH